MKTENFLANLKCLATQKCDRKKVLKTDFQEEIQTSENAIQEVALDETYKLNFQFIDIDKVFAN